MMVGSMLRIVILFMLVSLPALARDNGQWGNQPAYLREWFQKLMQPDNPHMSCCGEADAFEADSFEVSGDEYVAIIHQRQGCHPGRDANSRPQPETEMGRRQPHRTRYHLHRQ